MKSTAASVRPQELALCQRRSQPRLPLSRLRPTLRFFLSDGLRLTTYRLGVHFVGEVEITRLNETFLHHEGVTDVITFDYRDEHPDIDLCGEIFVCVNEAVRQARHFRTPWPDELVRYVVHGILHLQGYDDRSAPDRRRMKAAENRWLNRLRKESLVFRA